MKGPRHWLIKSEPGEYSFGRLKKEKKTAWTGIRNFEARNNLREMVAGDLALFYHSKEDKAIVGVARVTSEPFKDPTAPKEDWTCVEIEPVLELKVPVPLSAIKQDPSFRGFALIERSRLSVVPVSAEHFQRILRLGNA